MGRTYGSISDNNISSQDNVVTTKTVGKSNKKSGSTIGGIFIGLLLGVLLSVGGYFGYNFYIGKSVDVNALLKNTESSVESSYEDVFKNYGIELRKDFLQSSFTNSDAITDMDISSTLINNVAISQSNMDKFTSAYKVDKTSSNGHTSYSLLSSNSSVSIVFDDVDLKSINYQIINTSSMESNNVVTICGISSDASLSDILSKFGTPSYISVSDTFANEGYVSISLTYISSIGNMTISLSNMGGDMKIVSMSYNS